ncbi:MAG: serine/threonine protein phosphatase [Spirochaetes bacterium]|nr:serine/threonine protein phosphatase [Spirochaetota bacterium]
MYYIVGDIHGCVDKLVRLYEICKREMSNGDVMIFLGDYIDRGKYSYDVIEFLLRIKNQHKTIFLTGNHEQMLLEFLEGKDIYGNYFYNGGGATQRSYCERLGSFHIPKTHWQFYRSLVLYYEADDFIAVHAGIDPHVNDLKAQNAEDVIWIREKFYKSRVRFPKTVIFGHTPTHLLHGKWGVPYVDDERNIIGIDTAAVYGAKLTCLVWPQRKFLQI